jgi:type IV conjugative transfer system lipoprotein TraV
MTGVEQNYQAGNLPFQKPRDISKEKSSKGSNDSLTDVYNPNPPPVKTGNEPEESRVYGAPERLRREKMSPQDMRAMHSGEPLRQAPLVLRIWVAPFEDEEGDLHDQAFFYTQVHTGRWMIDATQSLIRQRHQPTYRLEGSTYNATPDGSGASAAGSGGSSGTSYTPQQPRPFTPPSTSIQPMN